MKLKLFIFPAILLSLASCNEEELKKIADLEAKNAKLNTEIQARDKELTEFTSAFNEIEGNLFEIKEREDLISNEMDKEKIKKNIKDRIQDDVNTISNLLEENKSLLANLEKKLKNSNYLRAKLEKLVEKLKADIEMKDADIEALNQKLSSANMKIDNLGKEIDTLTSEKEQTEAELKAQIDVLNTAYYLVGDFKSLRDANVVTKEGGFLGLGKSKEIRDDFNKSKFTKIDIRDLNSIVINADKVNILSEHDPSSYNLVGEEKVEKLDITNSKLFWSASKYLVIETK